MTTKTQIKKEPVIKTLKFSVLINVDKDTPGYHAYAPSLKGLHMGGDNENEARDNARTAASLYLKSLLKHGDQIPIDVIQSNSENEVMVLKKHVSSKVEEIKLEL
jgi:predicted RNase H-like HicB family nuclease